LDEIRGLTMEIGSEEEQLLEKQVVSAGRLTQPRLAGNRCVARAFEPRAGTLRGDSMVDKSMKKFCCRNI
jgi:hypothetical protein